MGEWYRFLRGKKMLLEKMNEPLEEQMGSVIVCGKICSGVMSISPLPSCDKHQSFLFDEISS